VYLISGVVAGAIYSLYASALTLIRSATGIYNLALGSFAFVADLFFYEASTSYMPRWVAFLLTVFVVAPLGGLVLEAAVFRRLARVPEAARLIATVGLLLGLPAIGTELVKLLTTQFHMNLPQLDSAFSIPGIGPEPPHIYHILGVGALTSDQLLLVVASAIAVFAMWMLLTRTRLGLMTRAVVDQSTLASTRGINPALTSSSPHRRSS
jgi:branched-subunit amino acid ABC-type transport system permease component